MSINKFIFAACLPIAVCLVACDGDESDKAAEAEAEAKAEEAPALEAGTRAGSFQLQAVVELVQGDEVGDAAALEAKINDPEAKLNAVDIDGDGETDFIEVIEVRKGGATILEFRAIPSSKKVKTAQQAKKHGVVIAKVELEVKDKETLVVHGSYTEHIDHDAEVHVYHHEEPVVYSGGVVVVDEGCFYHYAFVHEHEVYHGHHFHLVIDHHDHHKHYKHKHHKHKGHGHGHGHGHGGHKVKVHF